jgi:hypothetical protein
MPMLASRDSPRTVGSRVTVSVFDAVSGDAFVWVALAALLLSLENDVRGTNCLQETHIELECTESFHLRVPPAPPSIQKKTNLYAFSRANDIFF